MTKNTTMAATGKRASWLVRQLRRPQLDQRTDELAQPIRQSETLATTRRKVEQLATHAQATAEKLTTNGQAKGAQLTGQAHAKGSELIDRGLRRFGERLSQGGLAQRLGIQPQKRRLPAPLWLTALLAVAGGYTVALLTAPKSGAGLRAQLINRARSVVDPLATTVRSTLSHDPRTATLSDLNVTVTEGTVAVQGRIPPGFDRDALREVISQVPGVHDLDLQVTASA